MSRDRNNFPVRPTLLRGPYASPDVKLGDVVICAVHGAVEVRGFHDKGAISAPKGRVSPKGWAILVTGDLLRALHVETSLAICFYWHVSEKTVTQWRKALGIASRATESFLRSSSMVGTITGNSPETLERLRSLNVRPWTPEELALLPMLSAAEIIAKTGRTRAAIEQMRTHTGLKQQRAKLSCSVCGYVWLPDTARVPKRCARKSCRKPLDVVLPSGPNGARDLQQRKP